MSNPLSELSLLLHLSISQWHAEIQDQRALKAVSRSLKGDTSGDRYTKSLFVGRPLARIEKSAGRVRNHFYKHTLPWLDGGGRLLPSLDIHNFLKEHKALSADFFYEVDQFLSSYPEEIEHAQRAKGDLFQASEYPSQDVVRGRFDIALQIMPFPASGDFRVEAPEEVIEELRERIATSTNEITTEVATAMQNRVKERLARIHESLSDAKKRFGQSQFDELALVTNMCFNLHRALPDRFMKIVKVVDDEVVTANCEMIRHSDSYRAQVLKRVYDLHKQI